MPSVNIIGSGVIGLLSAHELLNQGFEVHLFDQGFAGKESTWAGGGIISPLFPWRYADAVTELALHSQAIYPSILKELKQYSPIDPEFLHSGMLMLDCDDFDKASQWQQKYNINIEFLNRHHIAQEFPYINPSFNKAAWMSHIHQIRNPLFADLLIDALKSRGAVFHEQNEIIKINIKNNQVHSISSKDSAYKSSVTLISSGAWTGNLIKHFFPESEHCAPAINPVHGQMLLLKLPKTRFTQIVLNSGKYIIPRKDGHVLVGSTTEMIGFHKKTTQAIRQQLLTFAESVIPTLKQATLVKHWSGLRPGSIKGIPTISRHPKINNLYVNAGHYRNGLVTAPASAQLIRHIICDQPPKINQNNFTFTRN